MGQLQLLESIAPYSLEAKPIRYRFHPLVRFFMIFIALLTTGYSIYFITILIPRYENVTFFAKAITVVVLYIALSTLYKHLTSLNSIIISPNKLELKFLLKKNITITWENLIKMEVYKVITHYWKIEYTTTDGKKRVFKTSLAFPGIMNALIKIQDIKPEIALNDLLKQVLLYKRSRI